MKKYKIELTENEFWKLQMFIVMYKDKLKEESEAYQKLVQEILKGNPYNYNDKQLATFINNQDWFFSAYETIHKIQTKLDKIPF